MLETTVAIARAASACSSSIDKIPDDHIGIRSLQEANSGIGHYIDWTIRVPDRCEYQTDLTSRLMCSASTGRIQPPDGPH